MNTLWLSGLVQIRRLTRSRIVTGSKPLLVVGRFVLGGGVGIISNCVPLYLSELPPANIRGAVVSTWQLTLAIGQVIGAVIAQGTKDVNSTFSWRFPIGKFGAALS